MSKRRSEDENAAPAKRGGAGYIGRRKEHRFEDVGDAKARLLDVRERCLKAVPRQGVVPPAGGAHHFNGDDDW